MKKISDIEWDRENLVKKYAPYSFPYINLGVELDVTDLYHFSKQNGFSFYCAMMHTAVQAALEIKNFRYRIIEKQPMYCEKLDPVFTHIEKGRENFMLIHGDYCDDIREFCRETALKMRQAEVSDDHPIKISSEDSAEILYVTCIPWVKYTHFVRTIENPNKDFIPRLSWGKYETDANGRILMPFSVQVHHALMDGYHVGKYLQRVQEIINSIR
ncbi:MAG: hypothetical protein LUD01_07205 [Clostridiales bacterium]|nr:hypothetical protein [Clostridiales bacterium]